MIYSNRILTNPYLEEESVSVSVWSEISYLANTISDDFWSITQSQTWNLEQTQYA